MSYLPGLPVHYCPPDLIANLNAETIMKERKEIEGKWWINGESQPPVYGILKFDPETGLELSARELTTVTIMQMMRDHIDSAKDRKALTIVGRDGNDTPISLFGCINVNRGGGVGLRQTLFKVSHCLVGLEGEKYGSTEFKEVYVSYTLLHNWMGLKRIRLSSDASGLGLKIDEREDVIIDLANGVRIELASTLASSSSLSEIKYTESHNVRFRFPSPISAGRIMADYIDVFRRLLSLFCGRVVFIEEVKFEARIDDRPKWIDLLQSNAGVGDAERDMHAPFMLVSYPDIAKRCPEVVKRWYELDRDIQDPLNLYFAVIFNDGLYVQQRFLFLAQALEVYHRKNKAYVGHMQGREEFKQRRDKIIAAVPDESKWLKEKLAYANEKSLAQRLKELLDSHQEEIGSFIPSIDEFVRKVRDARNHYTHYSTAPEDMHKIGHERDLLPLVVRLQAIIEICMLKEIGVLGEPLAKIAAGVGEFWRSGDC